MAIEKKFPIAPNRFKVVDNHLFLFLKIRPLMLLSSGRRKREKSLPGKVIDIGSH
jgi:hypothetical protein